MTASIERRLEDLEAAMPPHGRRTIKILTRQDFINWTESGDPEELDCDELDWSEAPEELLREVHDILERSIADDPSGGPDEPTTG